ncbi:peroxide stress protein YaaA [Shewanella sp. NIFS-20-20]|uniref:peroxide stress protein YaaA n=1 Tax=Shewanella sp. NIFS-20-20 TaxID=2853806 RepID=UPI001C489F16|nr:peroxide stress protein YaaA [Shewanella sp. NIFS-20-20]MBV7314192.1 peroxide stress protein YaaA [Shewanella sp. NIFS-20-20]
MLILVSPAKTLDFEQPAPTEQFSQPKLLAHSQALIPVCRELTPIDIASLMKVSDKIAGLNAARFASWQPPFRLSNAKQAMFAFRGDVYTGLDADSMDAVVINQAQQQLRILSGLYGLLKPLDLMQAYRLEMGTSLNNPRGNNLYAFWGDIITDELNLEMEHHQDGLLVNLASNEYFKAVKPKQLAARVITPVFKDFKNGQYKIISFYAKKARGLMTRYLLENKVDSVEQILAFNRDGYYYSPQGSSADSPVFLRDAP